MGIWMQPQVAFLLGALCGVVVGTPIIVVLLIMGGVQMRNSARGLPKEQCEDCDEP